MPEMNIENLVGSSLLTYQIRMTWDDLLLAIKHSTGCLGLRTLGLANDNYFEYERLLDVIYLCCSWTKNKFLETYAFNISFENKKKDLSIRESGKNTYEKTQRKTAGILHAHVGTKFKHHFDYHHF